MNLFREIADAKDISKLDVYNYSKKVLAENIECYVAKFFAEHPEAKVEDYELCYVPDYSSPYGRMRIWLKEKEKYIRCRLCGRSTPYGIIPEEDCLKGAICPLMEVKG